MFQFQTDPYYTIEINANMISKSNITQQQFNSNNRNVNISSPDANGVSLLHPNGKILSPTFIIMYKLWSSYSEDVVKSVVNPIIAPMSDQIDTRSNGITNIYVYLYSHKL